jgi:hypothetical protein
MWTVNTVTGFRSENLFNGIKHKFSVKILTGEKWDEKRPEKIWY